MEPVTLEEFEAIFDDDEAVSISWDGDNAFEGLRIIRKYVPAEKDVLIAAEHDIIYSVTVESLIKGGITKDDVVALRDYNWMISDDQVACFV